MNQLHPGVKWQFRLNGYILFLFFGTIIIIYAISLVSVALNKNLDYSKERLIALSVLGIYVFFVIIITEIYARMSYNRWFYDFNEEGLRLERGIIWKRYSNVPYERIQNIDIHRGILARMFGFSAIRIQTAGYSGRPFAEGSIPGIEIDKAEKIRDFVIKKITKK